MAETAGDVVRDALNELTVQAQTRTIPPIEITAAIRYLNRMMAAYDATGIKLGYTEVDSSNDVLTVSAGAVEGMVYNLAMRLANGYDIPVSPSLGAMASESLKTMEIIGVKIGKANFGGNLPVGSGNEDGLVYGTDAFFPGCCEDENEC